MSIARKSFETFAFRIPTLAFAVLTGILIARALGPEGKGSYTYVTTWTGLIIMFVGGQANAVSYEYGRRKRGVGAVLARATAILSATVLPAALILAGIALLVPGQLTLLALAVGLPFMTISQMLTGFFLADSDVRTLNVQQLLNAVVLPLLLIPVLFVARLGLVGLFSTWVFAYVLMAAYTLWRFRPYFRRLRHQKNEPYDVREQFFFGTNVSLNSVMSYLNFRIDVFIVLAVLGERALGVYSVGIGIGNLVWQLSRPVAQAAFGRINSSTERDAALLTARCVRHTLLMVSVAAVLLYFIGPPAAVLAYGQKFAGSGPVIRVLLPGIVAYSLTGVLATFISQQLARPTVPLIINTVATILCAGLTYATIGKWGIVGGAFATSVTYVVALTIEVTYFLRKTNIPVHRLLFADAEDLRAYRRLAERLIAGMWRFLRRQRQPQNG